MKSNGSMDGAHEIGNTAGKVWHTLTAEGPMSTAKLIRQLGIPRDVVMQAIGWLARENKVSIKESPRGRIIALR